MPEGQSDPEREKRIDMEIIVDCYGEPERALGWHTHLQDRLEFPFTARCIARRVTSPLQVGDEIEVTGLAPEEVCEQEIFMMICWGMDGLAVPLAQIRPVGGSDEMVQAIEDWHYWVRQE